MTEKVWVDMEKVSDGKRGTERENDKEREGGKGKVGVRDIEGRKVSSA